MINDIIDILDGQIINIQVKFDVVIGNPPYVRQELLGNIQKEYFSKKYNN